LDLVRKQTYLTSKQDRLLKELAKRDNVTEAEVLRRALDSWLAEETQRDAEDIFQGLIGSVEGPETVDHDDIYG